MYLADKFTEPATFKGGVEPKTAPAGPAPAPSLKTAPTRLKKRADEGADDYVRGTIRLNDRWRVVVCRDGLQWILQRGRAAARWDGNSYCQTREALLRCIRESASPCTLEALQHLAALPEHIKAKTG